MNLNSRTDEIRDKLDIVDLIGGIVPLKRAGKDFKGLCPFHAEKTPSFVVSPEKQIFHCFGCGMGGDIFSFMMKYENISFKEAVKLLGEKAGVNVILDQRENKDEFSKVKIFEINELAADYFHNLIFTRQGSTGKDYLKKRGFSEEIIKVFKIGYALPLWDGLIKEARGKKISNELLLKSGLIIKKEGSANSYYDRFRGRVIFPIYDIQSRVIGFSARVLDNSLPKYVNSPDTILFSKGKMLFGLNFTKREIIEQKRVLVCEGQIDVISLYQQGIKNVVASQGTAFTSNQARLLKRYTEEVVLAFDADEAGINAQLKGIEILLKEGLAVKMLDLPKGEDPDSLIKKIGKDEFEILVQKALPFMDFKLKILLAMNDIAQDIGRNKVAQEMLQTIAEIKSSIIQDTYVNKLSRVLAVSETVLWEELRKIGKNSKSKMEIKSTKKIFSKKTVIPPGEKLLIKCLLEDDNTGNFGKIFGDLNESDFQNENIKEIFKIIQLLREKKKHTLQDVLREVDNEDLKKIITEICCEDIKISDLDKILQDCIRDIKKRSIERRIQELLKEMGRVNENIQKVTSIQKEILSKKKELIKYK